jgi:hypothetical protein
MTATMPGVTTTLTDTYSALAASREAYSDRLVIIARTSSGADPTYAHTLDAKRYTSLTDVATVHTADSELYEAFYHAQMAGASDIWLCPISATPADDRSADLLAAYETLYAIRPSIIVPYGRGALLEIDANGTATRSVPVFGASPGVTDGAYADSSFGYLEDLADACAELSTTERVCIGILGMEALSDITPTGLIGSIGTELAPGSAFTAIPETSTFSNPENGKYLSVILGEVETAGMGPWAWRKGSATSYYRSNGALNYAGLISRLPADDAPTNKIVNGISNIAYKLSRNQTLSCISQKVVTLNVQNSVVRVNDAMTYSEDGSDYQRLSTVRICAVVDDMVRRVGQKFIGKGMRLETRNSFVTSLSSGFDNLIQSGALLDADFRVRYDGPNYTAYVDATIVPAWELRRIEFTIRVTFQGINTSKVL